MVVLSVLVAALARAVAIVLGAVALTVGTLVLALDASVAPVLSGSMRPALAEGDLIVVRPIGTASLEVGRVVVLADREAPRSPVAHRIVELEHRDDGTHVRTRGDANADLDPGPVVITDERTQVVVGHVPLVGRAMVVIGDGGARAVLAVVVASLTLALVRSLRRRRPA